MELRNSKEANVARTEQVGERDEEEGQKEGGGEGEGADGGVSIRLWLFTPRALRSRGKHVLWRMVAAGEVVVGEGWHSGNFHSPREERW